MKLRVLDLFSGIGGFSLGLERTGGFETVAFCEIEPYPRAVLRKHWPGVVCFNDVRLLNRRVLEMFDIGVDVICGGFPCQDISLAGKGAGLEGERSGLWFQFHRLIDELRPAYAIIENVAALRSRGLDQVLGSLAAIGYDAEWHCISAAAVGAPHVRDRIWIVAYPAAERRGEARQFRSDEPTKRTAAGSPVVADADGERLTDLEGCSGSAESDRRQILDANSIGRGPHYWITEPDVGRVANGVPSRVDRLSALGNAVVPQIPQIIGEAILAYERDAA